MSESKSVWNTLEVAKLIVGILMPIALAIFGFQAKEALQTSEAAISSALKAQEHQLSLSRSVIDKRKEIYDEIRIPLNNIYCYIEEVGKYKVMTPKTVIENRRELHEKMHTQRAYWSTKTFTLYLKYMDNVAFDTWNGVNRDAVIRDNPGQKKSLDTWLPEWQDKFNGTQHPEHSKVYNELLNSISNDLSAGVVS